MAAADNQKPSLIKKFSKLESIKNKFRLSQTKRTQSKSTDVVKPANNASSGAGTGNSNRVLKEGLQVMSTPSMAVCEQPAEGLKLMDLSECAKVNGTDGGALKAAQVVKNVTDVMNNT